MAISSDTFYHIPESYYTPLCDSIPICYTWRWIYHEIDAIIRHTAMAFLYVYISKKNRVYRHTVLLVATVIEMLWADSNLPRRRYMYTARPVVHARVSSLYQRLTVPKVLHVKFLSCLVIAPQRTP